MDFLQKVFWFVVTLAILIPIHEYGHYRVARACGVKVLRFSIGFGRVLFRREFGADRTEFALSMLPLGGYVKMLDEREAPVAPGELERAFNRRPLYQRALVVAAGPAANLLLAIVLYGFVQWYGLDEPAPIASTPTAGSVMAAAGLRSGDRIVASAQGDHVGEHDWRDVRSFSDVYEAIGQAVLDRESVQLRVTHPGEPGERTLTVPLDGFDLDRPDAGAAARLGLGAPYAKAVIGTVVDGSAAAQAGLKAGDAVAAVDGKPVADAQALRELILATADVQGGAPRAMRWDIVRDGRAQTLVVTPRIDAGGGAKVARVGVMFASYDHVFVRDDPLAALQAGARQTWRQAIGSLRMFGRMIVGQASLKNIGGPGAIAEGASNSAHLGFAPFLTFIAVMSVGLGVLNLLPIPMLDGGTLLYYLFEGATGRPVSELWQIWLQRGGALILLLLMSLALSNDLARQLGLQ
jgi:regulator of sigma E protease